MNQTILFTITPKRIKCLGLKHTKVGKNPYTKKCKKLINRRWHKEMKKMYCVWLEESIFSKWVYYRRQSTDSMQFLSSHQRYFFYRTRSKKFLISLKTQKTANKQCNLEMEKQSWRNEALWLQIALQSFSHQTMVIAPKQKYRSMD